MFESVPVALAAMLGASAVLVYTGPRLARVAGQLAEATGMGEAVAGSLLLGATTSLPGLITTILAALDGRAAFAVSNALGGIAAQTLFIAIADLSYRKVNLEHAAASVPNLLQAMVVLAMIGVVVTAWFGPDLDPLPVHPASILLVAGYLYGFRMARQARNDPMWHPEQTRETDADLPEDDTGGSHRLGALWSRFLLLGGTVAAMGYVIGRGGLQLADMTGLPDAVVAALGTAVLTSLPELVTAVSAARQGAVNLAVGDIVGGNSFDILFVAVADGVYLSGPIYSQIDRATGYVATLTVVLTAVFASGAVMRKRQGIGFEGITIFVIYGIGMAGLVFLS